MPKNTQNDQACDNHLYLHSSILFGDSHHPSDDDWLQRNSTLFTALFPSSKEKFENYSSVVQNSRPAHELTNGDKSLQIT